MICNHPGCTKDVTRSTRSGVCRTHMHLEGCLCMQCVARNKDRAGRLTEVKTTDMRSTDNQRSNKVTLPAMPWGVVG